MDAPATCIISRVAIVLVGIIYTGYAWRNQNSASAHIPLSSRTIWSLISILCEFEAYGSSRF